MKIAEILKRPLITEKSFQSSAQGFYSFEVAREATKPQIKKAVEDHFKVKVIAVKTLNYRGKKKRVGKKRMEIERPAFKKALVKLKEGDKIEIFETQETEKKG